ncbi:uracil-DNA glycosylase [Neobacillus sp. SAB-20_R2A]|uniref:uracil-DNA glycosylase n=1 Tax=Neobacillus sp. SAB-20_R2A TaxID=3120519 RepID=UPI003C6E2C31
MLKFIDELMSYYSDQAVFNPWNDYSTQLDIGPDAPMLRINHLQRFLEPRISNARYIFVAEALGFQGGHFSGIPMTSEIMITGNHLEVDYQHVFHGKVGRRTSNPNSQFPRFKMIWKKRGASEPTATIVWKTILENNVDPFEIILWNIFPFHPYDPAVGLLSNRTPEPNELKLGVYYLKRLLNLCPQNIKVIAIGNHSTNTLNQHEIENIPIRHPANGGAPAFKEGCKRIFTVNDVNNFLK